MPFYVLFYYFIKDVDVLSLNKFISRHKRLILFLFDACTIFGAFFLWFSVWPGTGVLTTLDLAKHCLIYFLGTLIFRSLFKTYESIWRYAGEKEFLVLILADALSLLLYIILILGFSLTAKRLSLIFISVSAASSLLMMLSARLCYKIISAKSANKATAQGKIPVAIIGAGSAGAILADQMLVDASCKFTPAFFLDDDITKHGRSIRDIKILDKISALPQRIKSAGVSTAILAIMSLPAEKKREIVNLCSAANCRLKVYEYPWVQEGKLAKKLSLHDINIEDLLCREPVVLSNAHMKDTFSGKTVLVTGGGGSIGSEICRQVANFLPKKLVILDIYENNAYDLQQEIKYAHADDLELCVEIASIRDREKIDALFAKHRPDFVFHAAAHKHVPLMEDCGDEAIKNNVFGTKNVIDIAEKYEVERFTMLSTDKAVNPTNIMGATKRICEMMIESKKDSQKTTFAAVRFGNVLGSNGSVIPLFTKQLSHGGPITITDKRIIRYFMTIPEAVGLVLQSAVMAEKGDIFVLDMGEPVTILSLAENLIKCAGYEPYKDIDIVEIGLRPGEKLYEELLIKTEELGKTSNGKIFVEKEKKISEDEISAKLDLLKKAELSRDKEKILAAIRETVPTYRSPEAVNCEFIK